ncbi:MAG: polyhydroxyalkanoic acid system family protein [Alphaproteobacteria bacterium]
MPNVDFELQTNLAMVQAVKKLEHVFAQAREDKAALLSGWTYSREGNVLSCSGTIRGARVTGHLTVMDHLVKVRVVLPLIAAGFRSSAEKSVREYLEPILMQA